MKRAALVFATLVVAVACGKTGVFTNERFACSTSGECADDFECRDGECAIAGAGGGGGETGGGGGATGGGGADGGPDGGADGGLDGGVRDGGAGAPCTTTTTCGAGLTCADGVCCRTACTAACDSCNQAGNLGTCLPRPAGSSAAACSGYACDGTSTSCPTTCSADAGLNACSPGYTCIAPTCGRCWSAVSNDFSVANDPAWALSAASISGGHLVVAVMSRNGQSTTTAATSSETLPLAGCGVSFALEVPPVPTAGYEGNAELFADNGARRPRFGWRFDTRGVLAAWALSDGGTGEQVLVPAGTTPPRWLRLEESGGQVRWRSTNGTSFNTVHSVSHQETLSGLKLEFNGTYPAQPGNDRTVYEVDLLNLGP